MALTREDLLAISDLMDVKLQPMNERFDTMESRLDGMDDRFDEMDQKFDHIEIRLERLESDVSGLKIGQQEIREDLNGIDQKVSYIYQLALDAWGTSVENRALLESQMQVV